MSFLQATLEALKGFADEVSTWTNQGSLVSIEAHIAQIEHAAAEDLHAGETAAKAVWADLYAAFHGRDVTEPEPAPAAPAAPTVPEPGVPAPVAADPTPAPSTTTEASSAPSSTPSDSTTDTPAA